MKEIISGLVRHGISILGSVLAAHGVINASSVTSTTSPFFIVVGNVLIILSVILSVVSKKVESKSTELSSVLDLVSSALAATPAPVVPVTPVVVDPVAPVAVVVPPTV